MSGEVLCDPSRLLTLPVPSPAQTRLPVSLAFRRRLLKNQIVLCSVKCALNPLTILLTHSLPMSRLQSNHARILHATQSHPPGELQTG